MRSAACRNHWGPKAQKRHPNKKNKIPRSNTNIEEGFWKRYTTNGVSRNGENEEAILDRTKGLINDYYFKKLLNLRGEYFAFKNKTS